jgi:hypothetical protein
VLLFVASQLTATCRESATIDVTIRGRGARRKMRFCQERGFRATELTNA